MVSDGLCIGERPDMNILSTDVILIEHRQYIYVQYRQYTKCTKCTIHKYTIQYKYTNVQYKCTIQIQIRNTKYKVQCRLEKLLW